jgi:hypothetical protein
MSEDCEHPCVNCCLIALAAIVTAVQLLGPSLRIFPNCSCASVSLHYATERAWRRISRIARSGGGSSRAGRCCRAVRSDTPAAAAAALIAAYCGVCMIYTVNGGFLILDSSFNFGVRVVLRLGSSDVLRALSSYSFDYSYMLLLLLHPPPVTCLGDP